MKVKTEICPGMYASIVVDEAELKKLGEMYRDMVWHMLRQIRLLSTDHITLLQNGTPMDIPIKITIL